MSAAYPETMHAVRPPLPACAAGKAHVIFCLTPHAPDCAERSIEDNRRWPHFWSVTPRRALAGLLALVGRRPGEVEIKALADGAAGVIAHDPRRPLAFCWDLSALQLETARAELAAGVAP